MELYFGVGYLYLFVRVFSAVSAQRSCGRGFILRGVFLERLRSSRVYGHWGDFPGAPAVQTSTHLGHHSQRHGGLLWRDSRGKEQWDDAAFPSLRVHKWVS